MTESNQLTESKVLRAGTILIPKPQHKEYLEKVLLKTRVVVTKEQEEANGTLGDMWMVSK